MEANLSDNVDQNPESRHNLGQYVRAKARHCTENHLYCIRTPLTHSAGFGVSVGCASDW